MPFPAALCLDKGVAINEHPPTLVVAAVCTTGRKPWLATEETHRLQIGFLVVALFG